MRTRHRRKSKSRYLQADFRRRIAWAEEETDRMMAGLVTLNEPRLEAIKEHQRFVDSDEYKTVMSQGRERVRRKDDLLAKKTELDEHARQLQLQLNEVQATMASEDAEFAEVKRKADEMRAQKRDLCRKMVATTNSLLQYAVEMGNRALDTQVALRIYRYGFYDS